MFVLVTQSDGSARRFTWVTYALAACLVVFYMQTQGQDNHANVSRAEAVEYLHENPYLEVGDRYRNVIPPDYAEAFHREYTTQREEMGLAPMSDHLTQREQEEFNALLETALGQVKQLAPWKLGIGAEHVESQNWLAHIAVHETQYALVVSLLMLLCLGIALEDGYGSIIFGAFAVLSTFGTGLASRHFEYEAATGMPWFGASGLIAALLGAYFVRSLRGAPRILGALPAPGWLLLPLWFALEHFFIRGAISLDQFVRPAALIQMAGLGLGVVVGTVMMLMRFEERSIEKAKEATEVVSNPGLERAMRAIGEGKLEPAFDLLRNEIKRAPKNRDVALAYWDVATQVGKSAQATEPMLWVVESDLQAGSAEQAVAHWFSLTDAQPAIGARPQLLVKVGEALLDAGHPGDAISALRQAIESDEVLPTALVQRIVRVARDLDPELTRKAAIVALGDKQLGTAEREELQALASNEVVPGAPSQTPGNTTAPAIKAGAPMEEMDVTEVDELALASPSDLAATNVEMDDSEGWQASDAERDADISSLDPEALDLGDLDEEVASESRNVEAQDSWNDPSLVEDLGIELEDDFDGDLEDFDEADLIAAAEDLGLCEDTMTMESVPSAIPMSEDTVTELAISVTNNDETTTAVNSVPAVRQMRVREAVPVSLESDAIVVEVDDGKKIRLPYTRIDALAAAAVSGAGARPVVVIDLIVNWQSAGEVLKVIRLRSDRFDPAALVPGAASQMAALQKVLADLLSASNATPLPTFAEATGSPFRVCQGLDDYAAQVLDAAAAEGNR
ncbi:MAG: membrane associated rhomboid family serine protease [Myxococcota bacterium]|jgi:membrane associated rhomboid family serine protease